MLLHLPHVSAKWLCSYKYRFHVKASLLFVPEIVPSQLQIIIFKKVTFEGIGAIMHIHVYLDVNFVMLK